MAFKMKGSPMHMGTSAHKSALKLPTYKQAYAAQSDEKKATQSEAEFTTAAKAWNAKQAAKKSNTTPAAEVVAKSTNKAPKAKPPTEISNKVNKAGLQTAAPGASGNVDKSHGHKTGSGKSGAVTTGKSNKGKSDTIVVSSGKTKGGSTVVNKDYATNREVDQTPKPNISKTKASDRKADKKGLNRQERKNYNDLQDTKKEMRKAEKKSTKVTGKQKRKNKANEKDAAQNKAMLAASDAKAANSKKEAARDKMVKNIGKRTL
jgi:hypothetical protein